MQITEEFLNFVENIMHSQNTSNNTILINYLVSKIGTLLFGKS